MDALKKAFVDIRAIDSLTATMQRVNVPTAVDDIAQMIRWAWENQVRIWLFLLIMSKILQGNECVRVRVIALVWLYMPCNVNAPAAVDDINEKVAWENQVRIPFFF